MGALAEHGDLAFDDGLRLGRVAAGFARAGEHLGCLQLGGWNVLARGHRELPGDEVPMLAYQL